MLRAVRTPRRSLAPLGFGPVAFCSLALLAGCPGAPTAGPDASAPPGAGSPTGPSGPSGGPDYQKSRYVQIRQLLEESPESESRSLRLYPLVAPLCTDPAERKALLEAARWSVSYSSDENYLPTTLALDLLEHVATTCFRHDPAVAEELLAGGAELLPKEKVRFDVIRARFLATAGKLDEAEAAAQRAVEAGSVHARALLATVLSQKARATGVGYRSGMYEAALAAVSVEPEGHWAVIDLTAVLSTRARLLSERSLWESGPTAAATLDEARPVYQRLSVAPFIEVIRGRALDVLCFDAAARKKDRADCARAATETHGLGAAQLAGVAVGPGFDEERLRRIQGERQRISAAPKGSTVLFVARGDEAELVEWARAASTLLQAVAEGREVVVVDRTATPRASAVLARILELAQVKPSQRLHGPKDTLLMPCVAAILGQRQVPAACPLPKAEQQALEAKAKGFVGAILVGRDLDGEIDDLRLYELPTLLLSFRQSQMEKGVTAWLKSLSDVWLFAAPPPP